MVIGQNFLLCAGSVSKKFFTFTFHKTADDGYVMVSVLQHRLAGDRAGTPLELLGAVLNAKSAYIVLVHSEHHGSDL